MSHAFTTKDYPGAGRRIEDRRKIARRQFGCDLYSMPGRRQRHPVEDNRRQETRRQDFALREYFELQAREQMSPGYYTAEPYRRQFMDGYRAAYRAAYFREFGR